MKPKAKGVAMERNRELCEELSRRGPLAVDVIINQLFAYRKQHGRVPHNDIPSHMNALYFLCVVIADHMQAGDVASVIQIFLWPEAGHGLMGKTTMRMLYKVLMRDHGKVALPLLKGIIEAGRIDWLVEEMRELIDKGTKSKKLIKLDGDEHITFNKEAPIDKNWQDFFAPVKKQASAIIQKNKKT